MVELVSEYDDEPFEGYDAQFCGSAAVARAYGRMFRLIAFIGRNDEGDLLGYWLRNEGDSIGDAPTVVLDNEGQFHCTASTLQDHFVQAAGESPEAVASIRRWFKRKGIETKRSPEVVWESVEGLPDPDEVGVAVATMAVPVKGVGVAAWMCDAVVVPSKPVNETCTRRVLPVVS